MVDVYRAFRQLERFFLRGRPLEDEQSDPSSGTLIATITFHPDREEVEYKYPDKADDA